MQVPPSSTYNYYHLTSPALPTHLPLYRAEVAYGEPTLAEDLQHERD